MHQTKQQGWELTSQRRNHTPTQRSSELSGPLYNLTFSAVNTTDISLIFYISASQGVPFTCIYSAQLTMIKLAIRRISATSNIIPSFKDRESLQKWHAVSHFLAS